MITIEAGISITAWPAVLWNQTAPDIKATPVICITPNCRWFLMTCSGGGKADSVSEYHEK